MIRKTLTILSLIGLLFSVGLWAVSYWGVYHQRSAITDEGEEQSKQVWVFNGVLLVTSTVEQSQPRSFMELITLGGPPPRLWTFGLDDEELNINPKAKWRPFYWSGSTGNGRHRSIVIPLYIPTVVFGVLFISCRPLHFHRRRKRKKLRLCVKCGYDLRGSKERCPECGEEFVSTNVAR